jgi:hypothetical protein
VAEVNRVFVVTQGIAGEPDAPWFVAEQMSNGAQRRVKSPMLPKTETKEACEDNLLRWLWIHSTTVTQRRDLTAYQFDWWLKLNGGREKVLAEGIIRR